ncbi:polysaccharide deacetylase family protein [Microbulbifer hainanensis]|uniref:polysaccharide deacetylase family protein n=1 Tax=Microbulbifer hainanensis TaxID=2735675 RepID=UPI001868FCBD|nr:polysaccharide deacetylase family protein [Microbulbifer hainanensis]
MKTLRVLLRRTLAIALLSIPAEVLANDDKKIALTFDDGPLPGATEALLDELDRLQIKATFFPVGSEMEKFPEQTKAIIDAGHSVGNHTYSHANLAELATPQAKKEIAGATRILRELGYEDPLMFRPPFGLLPQPLERELTREGTPVARWDLLPEAKTDMDDPQAVADYVADNAFPGAIVLLHPMYGQRRQVLEALPLISEQLRDRGYEFATLSEMLLDAD